jgi:hypothetical protein
VRPSLRFLTLAMIGWAGVRAATLGVLPGAELFRIERSEAKAPAIMPTQFPPIEPIEPAAIIQPGPVPITPVAVAPIRIPVIYAAASSVPAAYPTPLRGALPTPQPQFYSPIPALDEWPLSRIAAAAAAIDNRGSWSERPR